MSTLIEIDTYVWIKSNLKKVTDNKHRLKLSSEGNRQIIENDAYVWIKFMNKK